MLVLRLVQFVPKLRLQTRVPVIVHLATTPVKKQWFGRERYGQDFKSEWARHILLMLLTFAATFEPFWTYHIDNQSKKNIQAWCIHCNYWTINPSVKRTATRGKVFVCTVESSLCTVDSSLFKAGPHARGESKGPDILQIWILCEFEEYSTCTMSKGLYSCKYDEWTHFPLRTLSSEVSLVRWNAIVQRTALFRLY